MNSFYNDEELKNIGFKRIGCNVKISRKCSIYGLENICIGSNLRIDDFCILSGKIQLGNNIYVATYSALYVELKGLLLKILRICHPELAFIA